VNQGVLSPTTRQTAGVRGQLRLARNNTLNFNLVHFTTDAKNQGTAASICPSGLSPHPAVSGKSS